MTVKPPPIVAFDETGPGAPRRTAAWALASGASVGLLGGLIGLGGAEFRLPLLIGLFGFAALHAVILNKAMSLVVVLVALPARLGAVPLSQLTPHGEVLLSLLPGTLVGAWLGASLATRLRSRTLHLVLAGLLVAIAAVLLSTHTGTVPDLNLDQPARALVALAAGLLIGMVAAVMGVAGGELLIPTITLLFGLDIKTAGSLSLAISLPTMLVAFTRYSRDGSFTILRQQQRFIALMAAGTIGGTILGGLLVGVISSDVLVPLLAGLLVLSALKVRQHA